MSDLDTMVRWVRDLARDSMFTRRVVDDIGDLFIGIDTDEIETVLAVFTPASPQTREEVLNTLAQAAVAAERFPWFSLAHVTTQDMRRLTIEISAHCMRMGDPVAQDTTLSGLWLFEQALNTNESLCRPDRIAQLRKSHGALLAQTREHLDAMLA